jgi:hypothetical protein
MSSVYFSSLEFNQPICQCHRTAYKDPRASFSDGRRFSQVQLKYCRHLVTADASLTAAAASVSLLARSPTDA